MSTEHTPAEMQTIETKILFDRRMPYPDVPNYVTSIFIVILSIVCYYESIFGDFVFDDAEAIINNKDVRDESSISSLFQNDFWGTKLTHPSSHKSYRPLTVLSFRLNHQWGSLNPISYHGINILLHTIVCLLSLYVFKAIFGIQSPRGAAIATILFTTHPVHTEAVAGIVGRADLLCALFVFISFLAYVTAIKAGREGSFKQSFYLCIVAVATTLAVLCKEVGITALGLCSAFDVFLAEDGTRLQIFLHCICGKNFNRMQLSNDRIISSGYTKKFVLRHLVLFCFGVVLLTLRWFIMGSTVPQFTQVDNPASFMDDSFYRGINYQYIYFLNVLLLALPLWLCFDWSMGCVPLITTTSDWRILCLSLLWISFVVVLRRGFVGGDAGGRTVLMGVALIVVPFLPASNLFFRVGFVLAERVLYIPVAGFCLLVVLGMQHLVLVSDGRYRAYVKIFTLLLVVTFVFRCQQRTYDWLSEKSLFHSGLNVCPLNAKVHYNLGKVAGDSGNASEAVDRYRRALLLNPNYDQAMNNLANILKDQGQLDEALQLLQTATFLRSDFAAAWMNLGIVEASLGHHMEAERSYGMALRHRTVYPDCLYNLGNLYLSMGNSSAARSAWINATILKPTLAVAWTNLLILLDSQGQFQLAVETAQTALRHLPNDSSLHFNLANTLGKMSRFQDSESHFRAAISLDSNRAHYWANLGVLYHRWKRYPDARAAYQQALVINPALASARENLEMLDGKGANVDGSAV